LSATFISPSSCRAGLAMFSSPIWKHGCIVN
jgi:hypothetical protein